VKTWPSLRDDRTVIGFDIGGSFASMRLIKSLLRSVPGVSQVRRHYRSDDHLSFVFNGVKCTVNEPWGDNDRYWISPENVSETPIDMAQIHHAFSAYPAGYVFLEWLLWVAGAAALVLAVKNHA
jgi:hypothetical protein